MTTYQKHFGLSKAPFGAQATGNDVFLAAPMVAAVSGITKGMAKPDSIVCLAGPAGAGKTTIARHALHNVGENRVVVMLGRRQLGCDEVVKLLLVKLGARKLPKSTVHRLAKFRRVVQQYAERNARVIVLVEDVHAMGFQALSEIEVLTAAETGVSDGANVLLLGDETLNGLLHEPRMGRIKRRLQFQHDLAALSQEELRAYLEHGFRSAGKELDDVFVDGSVESLHEQANGLPELVNKLVVAALDAACQQDLAQVTPEIIARVAADGLGTEVDQKLPAAEEPEAPREHLQPAETQPKQEEIPAWDRDPTLAELRPDLDALEQAMADARNSHAEAGTDGGLAVTARPAAAEKSADANANAKDALPAVAVPEITLDRQIQDKIDEANPGRPPSQDSCAAASNDDLSESALGANGESRPEVQKIAAGLANAKSIEDVDDKLAETLFGEEFSMMAAQVAANAASMGLDPDAAGGGAVAADNDDGDTMCAPALSLAGDSLEEVAGDHDDDDTRIQKAGNLSQFRRD